MSARDWQPGDRAYIEVEVLRTVDEDSVTASIAGRLGWVLAAPTADLLPVPQSDERAIERARQRVRKYLADRDAYLAGDDDDLVDDVNYADEPDESQALLLSDLRLLASPVQPGRSEAEAVESWRDLHAHRRGVVLDRDGRVWQSDALGTWWSAVDRECHGPANLFAARRPLTWLHRAARVADTTDTEGGE